eukprot:COSAG04_NODE_4473_length_2067_cov_5.060976_3_plen_210_part_01
MDERYDLLRGKAQEDADATRERPHISLNVELAQLSEEESEFSLRGRFSWVWRHDESAAARIAEGSGLDDALHGDALSPQALERAHELARSLLELLAEVSAVRTTQTGDYSADPYHPKKPLQRMIIPGEGHFYDYKVADRGGEAVHLVKFLMSSGQRLIVKEWEALCEQEDGAGIVCEAVHCFLRSFVPPSMAAVAAPLVELVANIFLKWG